MKNPNKINAKISPVSGLDVMSRHEVQRLRDATQGGLQQLLRRCALAVTMARSMPSAFLLLAARSAASRDPLR